MLFDLSKDKSIKSALLKANLDDSTLELVNSDADITIIKYSLMSNMNSSNIVEYRRLIAKAEKEEENRAAYREATQRQYDTMIRLVAELEGISEDSVERYKLPIKNVEVKEKIKELREELKASKKRGKEETQLEEGIAEEQADLGSTVGRTSARQKKLEAAKESDILKRKKQLNEAYDSLKQAKGWIPELNNLIEKIVLEDKDGELKVKRLAEYQVFGNNRSESNEVIGLLTNLKENKGYLVNKYKKLLRDENKYKNVLIPIKYNRKERKVTDDMRKAIFVDDIQKEYDRILSKKFLKKYDIVDVLEQAHIQRHRRQPATKKDPAQRKRELQDTQRFLMGEIPKDTYRFEKVRKIIKQLRKTISTNKTNREYYSDRIKELKELEDDLDSLVARKIEKLSDSFRTLSSFKGKLDIAETQKLIEDIKNNKEKYIDELKEELQKDIEIEEAKYKKIQTILQTEERISSPLARLRKAMGKVERLYEDLGGKISGEIKAVFSDMLVPLINLKRISKKITKQSEKLDDTIEQAFSQWSLQDNETLRIDASGIGFEGVSDISYTEIDSLEKLRGKFDENVEKIDNHMNELDNLLKVLLDEQKEKDDEAREMSGRDSTHATRTGKIKVPKFERDEEGRIKDTPRAEEFDMDAYEERIKEGEDDYDYGEYTP